MNHGGVGNVVFTNRGICLYHNMGAPEKNLDAIFDICNIVDIGFDNGLTVSNKSLSGDDAISNSASIGELAYKVYQTNNHYFPEGIDYDVTIDDYTFEARDDICDTYAKFHLSGYIQNIIRTNEIQVNPELKQMTYIGINDNKIQNQLNRYPDIFFFDDSDDNIAKQYGNDVVNYKKMQIDYNEATKTYENDEYTVLGPFKVSYGVKGIGDIIATGYNEDGSVRKETSMSNMEWCSADDKNTWHFGTSELNQIENGSNIYIRVSDKYKEYNEATNIKVIFKQENFKYVKARILFLSTDTIEQQLAVFGSELCDYIPEVEVNLGPNKPAELTIVKKGENNKLQENVSFNLLNGDSENSYVHWNNVKQENGVNIYSDVSFTETADEKCIFTTGSSGKLIVKGLNSSYTYSAIEIKNENSGYETIDIKEAVLSNGLASVELNKTNSNTSDKISKIKLNSNQSNELNIVDRGDGGGRRKRWRPEEAEAVIMMTTMMNMITMLI